MVRRLLMAAGGGAVVDWTRGTLTADGSPVTVLADGNGNRFPGAVPLDNDVSRALVVYNRAGTRDAIYGLILTKTGTWTFTAGAPFLIYQHASQHVLADDPVSVVDGQVVITGRLYNGSVNSAPFILVCADPPASLSSSSSWGSPISVPLTAFTSENLTTGRVHKLVNGTYLVGYYGNNTSANFENGVLLSSSLTDWSAMTRVTIGPVHANNYTEIDIEETPTGLLIAHLRTDGTSPYAHFIARSSDHGATWTSPASAFTAHGYPMFRRRVTGLQYTIYRRSTSAFATYWRQSADDGATWSAESLLDGTLIGGHTSTSAYATIVPLDALHDLAVYSITDDRFGTVPANLYSQVITDSSTR